MRHLTKFILYILLLNFLSIPSFSAIKGGVDYSIPIDYEKLSVSELEPKAEFYYNLAINSEKSNEDMTSALNLYTMLTKIKPDNIQYSLRLGKLYDILGKDRYAKSYYYQAMNLAPKTPEPYFYLGDYFYSREQYRKALKFYKRAYENGYSSNYQTVYKLGEVYQKLGDTKNSLQYFQSASLISPNEDLFKKINKVEDANITNREFYKK